MIDYSADRPSRFYAVEVFSWAAHDPELHKREHILVSKWYVPHIDTHFGSKKSPSGSNYCILKKMKQKDVEIKKKFIS